MSHRNARLTVHGRRLLVYRVRVLGMPVARQVFTTNDERRAALPDFLDDYNHRRRHSALGGLPPTSRLSPT